MPSGILPRSPGCWQGCVPPACRPTPGPAGPARHRAARTTRRDDGSALATSRRGAPTSPGLANLAAHRLDRRLARLAVRLGADYTRYADDLTFSGTENLARSRVRLAALVAAIVADEGFILRHRKTRVMRRGGCQRVAGVVVNVRPNVPRPAYDLLKAILTNCGRHGPSSQNRAGHADLRAHLRGRVAQVAAVSSSRGARLEALFHRIQWDADPPS